MSTTNHRGQQPSTAAKSPHGADLRLSKAAQQYLAYADVFERDGVVVVRNVLAESDMQLLEDAFHRRLKDPSTTGPLYPDDETIVQSHAISIDDPMINRLLRDSAIADVAWGLFRGNEVWYWSEQAWLKEGRSSRTPWHQDLSYVPFWGERFVILWIPLDSLRAESVLEVVRKSHKGPLYNGSAFRPGDDTAPLYDEIDMPRLPDIESNRQQWDIFSVDMNRGDILAFHAACLHGGAPTFDNDRRRAMSFRLFSSDVYYRPLPSVLQNKYANTQSERRERLVPGLEKLRVGDPIHTSGAYRRVRPWSDVRP